MTTTLRHVDEDHCSVCGECSRCLLVTIADEVGDMRRSALTLRTMTAAVCVDCVERALDAEGPW